MNIESMETYLATPGLSSSALVEYSRSMKAGRAYSCGLMKLESPALKFGTYAHEIFEIGAERFWENYTLPWAGPDRRSKEGKEKYKEWQAEQEETGRPILDLTYPEIESLRGVGIALANVDDELTREWLAQPHLSERSVYWEERGMAMKCRPDRLITVSSLKLIKWLDDNLCINTFDPPRVVMDLKTAQSADPNEWIRRYGVIDRYGYDLKAAHYLAGTEADAFCWLAVEKKPPYHTSLIWLSLNRWDRKHLERSEILKRIQLAELSGEYPGYPSNVIAD
jgi:hypothetical protein